MASPRGKVIGLADRGLGVVGLCGRGPEGCANAMRPSAVTLRRQFAVLAQRAGSFPFFAEGRGVPVACFAPSGQVLRIEIARACLLNASSIHRTHQSLKARARWVTISSLHLQQVGAIGIELIGPQMRAVLSVNRAVAFTPHLIAAVLFALQHIAHAEVSANLLHVRRLALCR